MGLENPAVLNEQTGTTFVFDNKGDVSRAMGQLIKQPAVLERIQTEFTAIYKAANSGATKELRKQHMDEAITDLAARAVLSDLLVTMLTNGLPDGGHIAGEAALIQVGVQK